MYLACNKKRFPFVLSSVAYYFLLPLHASLSLFFHLFLFSVSPSLPLPYKASFFSLYIPVTAFPLPVFPVVRAYVRAYVHACVRKHLIYNNNGFSDRA